MKKILLFILIATFSFSSCEKDDICDANTSTTPRLVITFYDITNPSVLKNVTNMKVIGEGMTEGIVFNSGSGKSKYITSGSTISIPLKTDADSSSYSFILNYGNANPSLVNEDKITFNYTRDNLFVSRACGFKTVFALNTNNSYTHADAAIPDLLWINAISVEKNNIDNEYETHIKIFF
ncbi:DUF6452 family protein [uncultured Flavobacterium sp.]|uniref:DUF6452 family protein n=1 Tax=uncultured Flavobacterium sp. TaxID=165435 RepID=UPI0030CA1342